MLWEYKKDGFVLLFEHICVCCCWSEACSSGYRAKGQACWVVLGCLAKHFLPYPCVCHSSCSQMCS